MTYAVTNPPRLVIGNGIGGALTAGNQIWIYSSADDDATVNGAGYISNAGDLGMRVGDFVYVWDATTPKGSIHYVSAISSGAATLAFAAVS